MRRRTFAASALAWSGAARGQAAEAAQDGALGRIRAAGVLRVGVVGAQPPYSWKDLATGQWTGFMVDAATDLADSLGCRIEPVESSWGQAVLEVQAGKVDLFMGLAPTEQRRQAVDFSLPLYENAFALIARPGFAPSRWADLDDPGVRIALELGTVYDQTIGTLAPRATVTRLRTNNEALLSVQAGRADAQVIVVILALVAIARNRALGHLVVPEPVYASPTASIMAKEAQPGLRAWADGWVTRRRAEGWIRRTLVANLAKVGVDPGEVPPHLLF